MDKKVQLAAKIAKDQRFLEPINAIYLQRRRKLWANIYRGRYHGYYVHLALTKFDPRGQYSAGNVRWDARNLEVRRFKCMSPYFYSLERRWVLNLGCRCPPHYRYYARACQDLLGAVVCSSRYAGSLK